MLRTIKPNLSEFITPDPSKSLAKCYKKKTNIYINSVPFKRKSSLSSATKPLQILAALRDRTPTALTKWYTIYVFKCDAFSNDVELGIFRQCACEFAMRPLSLPPHSQNRIRNHLHSARDVSGQYKQTKKYSRRHIRAHNRKKEK